MTSNSNPLENIFDIDPGSTPTFDDMHPSVTGQMNERSSALVDPTTGEIVPRKSNADTADLDMEERLEDLHIDGQLEQIHNIAITAFEKSARMAEEVDPKFAARNAEVAAQYLTLALNSVNSRVDAKFKRQKVRLSKETAGAPSTVNNNVFVADRNVLLKQIFGITEPGPVTIEANSEAE
jgi:hypothetical protein